MESKSGKDNKRCRHRFRPHYVMPRENVNSILSSRKKKVSQVGVETLTPKKYCCKSWSLSEKCSTS